MKKGAAIFEAAGLILKVNRLDSKKQAEDVLEVLIFTPVAILNYQVYPQNIESCKKDGAERLQERCSSLKMPQ